MDKNDNGIDDKYESPEYKNVNIYHSNFSRYSHFIPQWIWSELMGISPQRRRSFLLQNEFRTPLTFDYIIFEIFTKVGSWSLFFAAYRLLWEYLLSRYFWLTVILISGFILVYVAHKIAQVRDTEMVKEEIQFQIISDVFSLCLSLYVIYADLIPSLLSKVGL